MATITVDKERLEGLCRSYSVHRLAIFGSRSRGDEQPDSDLDLLVEFEPNKTPGLKFFRLQRELSNLFHLNVDLNTAGFLSPYFRDEALQSAKTIYAAA
jgi:predicted nucleotidyltransferase